MRQISPDDIKKRIQILNPHWETGRVDPDIELLGKRGYFELFFPLVEQSQVNRAVVLMGPRRAGKTVMLYQAIRELINKGIAKEKILFIPVDIPLLQGLTLDELIEAYRSIHALESIEGCFLFFDEIQYHAEWDRHLKTLVDQHKRTRFVVSGSAAAALQRKSKESGAGRFTDFLLPPLSFHEYLDLLKLTDEVFERGKGGGVRTKNIVKLNEEFIRYLNYGGYPEAIFNEEIRKNPERFIRSDIIDKVLLKDLPSLYGIQDIQELTKLFNALAYQTGNEITLEGLSKSSGVAKNTIKRYIEYLEAAFLIKTVSRVDNSGKTFKRENYFKVYLTNPSMYAAIFNPVHADSDEIGSLVETALFGQYMHDSQLFDRIYYARWKDSNGAGEVDIVHMNDQFKVSACIEVKWSDEFVDNPQKLKSLIKFCDQCGHHSAVVTTRTRTGSAQVNGHAFFFTEAARACFVVGEFALKNRKMSEALTPEKLDAK